MNAQIFNLASITVPKFETEKVNKNVILFGEDNLFPQFLLKLQNSVTHQAALNLKTMAVAGSGYTVSSEPARAFLENLDFQTDGSTLLNKISASINLFDGFALEVIWNKKGDKIATIQVLDFEKIRAIAPDPSDRSNRVRNYNFYFDITKNKFDTLAAFDPTLSKSNPSQIVYIYIPSSVSKFYPKPRYSSAVNYILNEQEMSKHYLNSTINAFLPSSMITFIGNPTREERDMNSSMFSKNYTGSENSNRLIINYAEAPELKPQIDAISANNVVDQYINAQEVAKSMIIKSHGILSPALLADSDSNTSLFSNGQELQTIWDIFYNTEIAKYQQLIEKTFNMVLKYAGFENENYKITPFNLLTQTTQPPDTQNIN